MAQKRFYVVLAALSSKELEKFNGFLHSGMEKTLQRELQVWDEIYSVVSKKRNPNPETWESISEPLMDRRIRSNLLSHLSSFLSWQEFKKNEELGDLMLLRSLNERKLDEVFAKVYKRIEKEWQLQDSSSIIHLVQLKEEFLQFQTRNPERFPKSELSNIHKTLDEYYYIQKLRYAAETLNQAKILAQDPAEDILASLQKILQNFEREESNSLESFTPLTWMYFYTCQTLRDEIGPDAQEDYLHLLLQTLKEQAHSYPATTLVDLYNYCLNFCARQINTNHTAHYPELILSIYNQLLLSGIILDSKGQLSPFHYKNIATIMTRLKKYEWVRNFIKEYGGKLAGDTDGVAQDFGHGLLLFYQQAYSQAFARFDQVIGKSNDLFFGLDARAFQLKIIFHNREQQPDWMVDLDQSVNRFRMALNRRKDKLSHAHKENYLEFIRFTSKLSKIVDLPTPTLRTLQAEAFLEKLLPIQNVADKSWLIQQVNIIKA